MAKLINKMLNFVGLESDEEYMEEEQELVVNDSFEDQSKYINSNSKKHQNKIVNIHQANQFKVVVMQPEDFEDARGICDHLKSKKPIVINLENLAKEVAQRVVDFLSGAVYALDGDIQRISSGIFLIAPNNVDIMGEFKDELKNKGVFPWAK